MSNAIGIIDIDGSAQPLVTLHENEAAAVVAGSSLVFRRLRSSRDTPWEVIQYPGSNSIRAKFLGSKPRFWIIEGDVINTVEATMRTEMKKLFNLNASKARFRIDGTAALILEDSEGFIIENVDTDLVGDGSGPIWSFRITLRDLTTS